MFGIGGGELIVILVVVILLFGAKRIPEIARGLGRAAHEFKKAKDNVERETGELLANADKPAPAGDGVKRRADEEAGKPNAG